MDIAIQNNYPSFRLEMGKKILVSKSANTAWSVVNSAEPV
jgi:hypothetical protein